MRAQRPRARAKARLPAEQSDFAFHAANAAVLDALASRRHCQSLREFFGTSLFEELSVLARAARKAKTKRAARVIVVPGMMGSRLCALRGAARAPARAAATRGSRVLWIDPRSIAAGGLKDLVLPSGKSIRARGVLLPSYARLKLQLAIEGFDARFFAYDWRLGIDRIGSALAAAIRAGDKPAVIIAHSMGALAARFAVGRLPRRKVRRLILLGAPNRGSFAPVLALRGTYPFVQRLSRLDLKHSAEHLAARIFSTFPGLYQLLPLREHSGLPLDLLDPANWPSSGPRPDPAHLARVAQVRAGLSEPDSRMVQIVGINRETIVGLRRSGEGFEYVSSRNGDGTVPVAMALVPGLTTYYADESHGNLACSPALVEAIVELVRSGSTGTLAQRFKPHGGAEGYIDDARLGTLDRSKIDWRMLDSVQREAVMADLDGPDEPEACRSATSLA
jgi:hypothetical protein